MQNIQTKRRGSATAEMRGVGTEKMEVSGKTARK
jgi:hypothetical protein